MSTGTRVQYDPAKHPPAGRGTVWDTLPGYDGVSAITQVVLLGQIEEAAQHGPSSGQESLADEPKEPARKPRKGAPRKLIYGEAIQLGRADLSDSEHRLLMAMWRYADNEKLDGIWPSHTRLAEMVNLKPTKSNLDNLRMRIRSLEVKGYIVKVSDGRTVPTRRAAEYRLTLPEWETGET